MYSDTSLFSKKNIFNLLLLGILALGIPLSTNALKEAQILRSRADNAEVKFVGDNVKLIAGKPVTTSVNVTVELAAKYRPRGQTAMANFESDLAYGGLIEKVEANHNGTPGWGDEFVCEKYGANAGAFQWLSTTTYNGWQDCKVGRWTHFLRENADGQTSQCNWTSEYTISCPGQPEIGGSGEIPVNTTGSGTAIGAVDCDYAADRQQYSCDASGTAGTWWCHFCSDGTPRCYDSQSLGNKDVCKPNASAADPAVVVPVAGNVCFACNVGEKKYHATGDTNIANCSVSCASGALNCNGTVSQFEGKECGGTSGAPAATNTQSPNVCYVCDQSKYRENTSLSLDKCSSECNGLSSDTCHGGRGAWQGKDCIDPKDPNDVALTFTNGATGGNSACASVSPVSYLSPYSPTGTNVSDLVARYYLRSDSADGAARDSHGPLLDLELPSDYDQRNAEERKQDEEAVANGTKAADELVKLLQDGNLVYRELVSTGGNVDGEVAQYFLRSDSPAWAKGRAVQGGSNRIMYPPNPVVNKLVDLVKEGKIYVKDLCGGPAAPAPAAPATTAFTTSFKMATSQAGLSDPATTVLPYDAHPKRVQMILDADPNFRGTKTVFVEFSYSDGTKEVKSASIDVIGNAPVVSSASCSTDLSGTKVAVTLTGTDFGSSQGQNGKLLLGNDANKKVRITSWSNTSIVGTIDNAGLNSNVSTVTYPLSLYRDIDLSKVDVQCGLNTAQISVGGSLICHAPNISQLDNVELTIVEDKVGGSKTKETVSITKEGIVKGSSKAILQKGQKYKVCLKAPGSLRKCFDAVGSDGTVVIKDSSLPVGDVFPDEGDCQINSLDATKVKRDWTLTTGKGKKSDFNQDGVVNSIDWTCMKKDFGQSCSAEPTAPVGAGTTAP